MAQAAGWQTTVKKCAQVRKGTLSQQAPGKGLKINPQVSNLRTVQNSIPEPHKKRKTEDPQTDRRRNTSPRPPSLKPSQPTSLLWAVVENAKTKNVRLHRLSWTWLQTCFNASLQKWSAKQVKLFVHTPHYSQQKNNHATSNAFMATFTMPLAKVVLYIAVSGQFTSFMGACWLKHVHCPKCSFMILTNGWELEVKPQTLTNWFSRSCSKACRA